MSKDSERKPSVTTYSLQTVPIQAFGGLSGPDVKGKRSYGIVIRAGTCEAHVAKRLCDKCDSDATDSSIRQLLRAYETTLRFAQKIKAPTMLKFHQVHSPYLLFLSPSSCQKTHAHVIRGIIHRTADLVSYGSRVLAYMWPRDHKPLQHYIATAEYIANLVCLEPKLDSVIICTSCLQSFSSIADLANHFQQVHLNKNENNIQQNCTDVSQLIKNLSTMPFPNPVISRHRHCNSLH